MSEDRLTSGHSCVDCAAEDPFTRLIPRPIVTKPGARNPRCFTHDRAATKAARKQARGKMIERTRGVSATDGADLLRFQGGVCWFCQRATGASKALAFDHDHRHCSGKTSCATCLRGRLCSTCNQMLGHLRDDADAFQRVADYLRGDTPWNRLRASKVLGQLVTKIQFSPSGVMFAAWAGGAQSVPTAAFDDQEFMNSRPMPEVRP
jgi:hypothetical protein